MRRCRVHGIRKKKDKRGRYYCPRCISAWRKEGSAQKRYLGTPREGYRASLPGEGQDPLSFTNWSGEYNPKLRRRKHNPSWNQSGRSSGGNFVMRKRAARIKIPPELSRKKVSLPKTNFWQELYSGRKALGMTAKALSRLASVGDGTVRKIERQLWEPSEQLKAKLRGVLGGLQAPRIEEIQELGRIVDQGVMKAVEYPS